MGRVFALIGLVVSVAHVSAQNKFQLPEGGWTYIYEGDAAAYAQPGEAFGTIEGEGSLDGTWSHDNGSDQWDGSEIGGEFGDDNRPGGAMIIEEGGTSYLRIQDTGDPRDYGYSDPSSNRKVYLGHNIAENGASETVLDDGVTLTFRARVPLEGPLDILHPNGQSGNGTQPYPENGDGYVTSDQGKGNFVIRQSAGGAIAFSLTTATDTPNGDPNSGVTEFTGLSFNEFDGNALSDNVNFGQGLGKNVVALDPTQWHEFWVTIEKDPNDVGTHVAAIYIDGNLSPELFNVTAGNGGEGDFSAFSYLAMGATATPQSAALDIDFFGFKLGAVLPQATSFKTPAGGWDYRYEGDTVAYAQPGEAFGTIEGEGSLDGTWSHDNGSDQWDGSEIGGEFGDDNRPGGAMIIEEGGTSYLRIQDTGDPRDYGYSDPSSNRKVYLGHNIAENGASETVLDDGVTLTFRARVPLEGPLDILHPNGQSGNGTQPYPENGDGYVTSDQGKGNFVIRQSAGGAIAFSLTTATDTPNGDPNSGVTEFTGLSFNEFDGNALSDNVNFGQGLGKNVVALDPTQWHEFWVTIEKDPNDVGTHVAAIYIDGNLSPELFNVTAGNGGEGDFSAFSYLAMGATATPQSAALDIDFFGFKLGAVPPEGAVSDSGLALSNLSPEIAAASVDPAVGVSFVAASSLSIPRDGISVTLNGRDYSSSLTITGDEQRWEVSLTTLNPNQSYSGEARVTNSGGASLTRILNFDTYLDDNQVFEGEDYNFGGGKFIDNPAVSFAPNPNNNYWDQMAVLGTDIHDVSDVDPDTERFRFDGTGTSEANDFVRPKFSDFPELDFMLTNVEEGEWVNYTRTIPSNDDGYSLVARLDAGGSFEAQVDLVSSPTSANPTLTKIGTFSGSSSGGFSYFHLLDDDGNNASFPGGGVTTFRVTATSGDYDANFYMVIPFIPSAAQSTPTETLSISGSGSGITITWDGDGTLESASSVTGPWSAVGGASSPYSTTPAGTGTFYRARN